MTKVNFHFSLPNATRYSVSLASSFSTAPNLKTRMRKTNILSVRLRTDFNGNDEQADFYLRLS